MTRSDEKIVVTQVYRSGERCLDYTTYKKEFMSKESSWEEHMGDIDFDNLENNSTPASYIEIICGEQYKRIDGLRFDLLTDHLKELRGIN